MLVADDDPVARMVVSGLLRRAGQEADTAIDGIEAVEAAARRHYDLVLMDIEMPEIDGFEACRRISESTSPAGRIVALTATLDDDMRARCRAAGFDDVLEKPLRAEVLDALIGGLREIASVKTSMETPEETAGETPEGTSGETPEETSEKTTETTAEEMSGPDAVLSLATFERLRAEAGRHMSRPFEQIVGDMLATMREQLESLRHAAGQEDRATVARLAHMLRGSAATIGAEALRRRAGTLELDADSVDRQRLESEVTAIGDDFQRAERRVCEALDR